MKPDIKIGKRKLAVDEDKQEENSFNNFRKVFFKIKLHRIIINHKQLIFNRFFLTSLASYTKFIEQGRFFIVRIPMRFIRKHELIVTILSVLVLIGAAASYYFYTQYKSTQDILKNPNLATEKQTKAIIEEVSKLIELPNEQPTIATITDVTKLKDQPFFAHAKNGDKVLIYTGVKKAILYDPTINKIVDVAPVNIGDQTTPTPSAKTTVITPTTEQAIPTAAPQISPTSIRLSQ